MGSRNEDVACYLVMKHSTWKGKYRRIFCICKDHLKTYNPSSMEVTNQWHYNDFIGISPSLKGQVPNEFIITMRKGKKVDSMKFSSEFRTDILTEALNFRHKFDEKVMDSLRSNGAKIGWSERSTPVVIDVTPNAVEQLDPATGVVVASYYFRDLECILPVSEIQGGLAFKQNSYGRLHIFCTDCRDEIIRKIEDNAKKYIGITIPFQKSSIPIAKALDCRLGNYREDCHITSLCEFSVYKLSSRHNDPVKRIMCLSETCLIERDPNSYSVITLHPLAHVFALVRNQADPQMFVIEYINRNRRSYTSSDRDAILASLLDGVRASGNMDVHVRASSTPFGMRLGVPNVHVEEDVESMHLKFFQQPPVGCSFSEVVQRFNANVSYSGLVHSVSAEGLFAENKEKLIMCALAALLQRDEIVMDLEELEGLFHSFRRLLASKAGFSALTGLPGFRESIGTKVVRALARRDSGVTHAALDMICALMQPMHDHPDLKQEQLNKASLLSSTKFLEKLIETWVEHVNQNTGALVVGAFLDFLTFALCAPYSETTEGAHFDRLLDMVSFNGKSLYKLFQHTSLAIVKGAGLVLKAIIEEGNENIPEKMQHLALTEGALPRHLYSALFIKTSDGRLLTHRQLSRHLISLWTADNEIAMDLLTRTLPRGLLTALESREAAPLDDIDRLNPRDNLRLAAEEEEARNKKSQMAETLDKAYRTSVRKVEEMMERHSEKIEAVEKTLQTGTKHIEKYYEQYLEKHVGFALQHWRTKMRREKSVEETFRERPLTLRKRRERLKSSGNWPLLYYMFNRDHALPNLIWNYKTRDELRIALESEIRCFTEDDVRGSQIIAWNHAEFEVSFPSLKEEIKIGDYYLRILLEQDGSITGEESPIRKPYEFFNDLYHRFLLTPKVAMKCMCLQAMALVYGLHHREIGSFNDTRYIVTMLARTFDKQERDRLLLFLSKLMLVKENVREIVEAGGIKTLTDLMTLAHLHVSRAVLPTMTNVIEASPEMMEASAEKEWFYQNSTKSRSGPFSFKEMKEEWAKQEGLTSKTLCWAQGMDGWYPLVSIPQLKWTLSATGQSVMTESDLTILILNMLITMCRFFPSRTPDGSVVRPLPRLKRFLSDMKSLPHIVQLLCTFDPIIVEKVATLALEVLQDNPVIGNVYTTGIFFFILMYMGSNVLPISKFLFLAHLQQNFRSDESSGSDIMQQSILGQLLPEAMVCYLQNYGPEKFAEIFLGEFDTPEVIWSSKMRRLMIEKIAAHLSDFSPRLLENAKAVYQYCSIPHIVYPQLSHELFCDIYYLKHLCDTDRFPDWPIKEPVELLKKVLMAWRTEVEKQPSSMSAEDAYAELGLSGAERPDDAQVRKAYFRLAQKYHPDKNPNGREIFERVNKAYEFLCSRSSRLSDGPDPKNILLILRTQSILFSRYKEVLSPYKYSGYPMLIKTIQLETDDDQLFSKETSLLAAAANVAYHTIDCSALNAEELRRENGLEVLQCAYNRCVSVLSAGSAASDVAVQVCVNIARCYAAAAQFSLCREKLLEMLYFVKDLCHVLYFKHLTKLCLVSVECASALAIDHILQMNLLQAGVLWHLLIFLYNYDFTLEEGGVSKSEESNHQELNNQLAIAALRACGRLAGLYRGEEETPKNTVILGSLNAMLTPYITSRIQDRPPENVLKLVTSNSLNPYLIWDNGTRTQIMDFLLDNQQKHVKTGQSDPSYGADFVFDAHKDELVIGGVFIRIYNEQPTFVIENAKELAVELLQYIGGETQYVHSLLSLSSSPASTARNPRLSSVSQALQALANNINNNRGVEMQCIGHFKLLFSLLGLEGCRDVQRCVLSLIEGVTGNADCVADIGASEVLAYLLLTLYSPHLADERLRSLGVLHALMSNTKIVKEALNKGGLLYLLQLFCSDNDPQVREKTAELMGKMSGDKLVGPKVRLILSRLLPACIVDQMRDCSATAVHMYQAQHENPELIWTDESRDKVSALVSDLVYRLYVEQRKDPNFVWKFPEEVNLTSTFGEVVVGGVYLRLLLANPAWVLRRPKQFVTEFLDELIELFNSSSLENEKLETMNGVIGALFAAQRPLLDFLPSLGHIPRIVSHLSSTSLPVARTATLSVHQFSFNKLCCVVLEGTEVIGGLMSAMQRRADVVGTACEAMHNMFSSSGPAFVEQGMRAKLIPFLLSLLENQRLQVNNPASTKAQIVTCLKTMAASAQHSEEVNYMLEKSSVWAQYKDQKHDLFLDSAPVAGYLQAASPGVSGFLTQGNRNISSQPPAITSTRSTGLDLP